jgi:hypothetical protein
MDVADAFNNGTMTLDTLVGNMQRPTLLAPLFALLTNVAEVALGKAGATILLAMSTFNGAANMIRAVLA